MAEGVPLIEPVDESSERPLGKEGETDHVVMVPPLEVGVTVVMAVPFVKVKELGLYESEVGAISLTTMVTSAVVLPPVLLAVTVYVVEEETTEGVPEMAPVEESNDRPVGSEGETDHVVMVPPLAVGVTVVMAVPLVKVNVFGL